jgi:hypothetical protein
MKKQRTTPSQATRESLYLFRKQILGIRSLIEPSPFNKAQATAMEGVQPDLCGKP